MIFRRMGADPSVSISSDSPNSNNSDTTLPWNPDLTSPNSNNSDTTLSRTSYLTPSEPDSNRSNITLPSISEPIPPDTNYSDVALPGFSTLLAPNNSVTPDRNYYKDLVPGNFRSSGPYKAGPTIENYSGVSDPRNLHPSIPDRHTLNSEPPLPLKRILSQPCLHCSRDFTLGIPCSRVEPCFECVKSNKFCSFPQSAVFVEPDTLYIPFYLPYFQSEECSKDPSRRQNVIVSVRGTKTTAEFIEVLNSTILTAIPPAPNHIFFRYHFPGGVVTANNFTLVKDLNWAEGDYMEARAFDTNTGIEMHGCMVGWYPKSV
ncbi:hypothetical protein BCIN_12g00400 [Botrytis cinerea B05.10]|uniref:Uncharacterized protein n=1 Tax=Botryotinia fuckeliana (strain B05.10) TaxID=332648 RepID=A0A384JYJ8_BOTFB|nr:hypothetical protein BCIN_12g00400 [Botrytis cinerea B05.10]ATZ55444.1 hypothetical protein BCIN_12g00400 [Botrytis cinerea B05.10]